MSPCKRSNAGINNMPHPPPPPQYGLRAGISGDLMRKCSPGVGLLTSFIIISGHVYNYQCRCMIDGSMAAEAAELAVETPEIRTMIATIIIINIIRMHK